MAKKLNSKMDVLDQDVLEYVKEMMPHVPQDVRNSMGTVQVKRIKESHGFAFWRAGRSFSEFGHALECAFLAPLHRKIKSIIKEDNNYEKSD